MVDISEYVDYDFKNEYRLALNKKCRERYNNNHISTTGVSVREASKRKAKVFNSNSFTCEHCHATIKNGSRYRHLYPHRNYNNKSGKVLSPTCKILKYGEVLPKGKIKCDCGSIMNDISGDKNRHLGTLIHMKWMESFAESLLTP